jgi:hypothetical protein
LGAPGGETSRPFQKAACPPSNGGSATPTSGTSRHKQSRSGRKRCKSSLKKGQAGFPSIE